VRPPDMTDLAVLAERHQHGTRVRYMTGCRCVPCRAANSRYSCARELARKNGDRAGIVCASRARRHLEQLGRHGIGRYVAAEASGLNPRRIAESRSGKKKNIRERTERAILSVTLDARGAKTLVDARPVWVQIERLLGEGLTRRELARRLGSRAKNPALQLSRRAITAQNAMRVERLLSVMRADTFKRYKRRPIRLRPIPQRRPHD
jgi:hypothetical protein